MAKKTIYFFFGLTFTFCTQTILNHFIYPNDPKVSGIDGTPKDSLIYYYPTIIRLDRETVKTEIDSFSLDWFSRDLREAKEPILFNYYLGHDLYRFLWLRSFHKPVVFILNKWGNKVTLTTKMLNHDVQIGNFSYDPRENKGNENEAEENIKEELKGRTYKTERYGDSLVVFKVDEGASIIFNDTKQLSKKEWDEFEAILRDCSFWTTKPHVHSDGLDGSEWTIEGHLGNGYWFVTRWCPKDKFRKAGEFLINKSKIKEEIY